jgi:hypothetical protein
VKSTGERTWRPEHVALVADISEDAVAGITVVAGLKVCSVHYDRLTSDGPSGSNWSLRSHFANDALYVGSRQGHQFVGGGSPHQLIVRGSPPQIGVLPVLA